MPGIGSRITHIGLTPGVYISSTPIRNKYIVDYKETFWNINGEKMLLSKLVIYINYCDLKKELNFDTRKPIDVIDNPIADIGEFRYFSVKEIGDGSDYLGRPTHNNIELNISCVVSLPIEEIPYKQVEWDGSITLVNGDTLYLEMEIWREITFSTRFGPLPTLSYNPGPEEPARGDRIADLKLETTNPIFSNLVILNVDKDIKVESVLFDIASVIEINVTSEDIDFEIKFTVSDHESGVSNISIVDEKKIELKSFSSSELMGKDIDVPMSVQYTLPPGSHALTFIAKDKVGNETNKVLNFLGITFTFIIDTPAEGEIKTYTKTIYGARMPLKLSAIDTKNGIEKVMWMSDVKDSNWVDINQTDGVGDWSAWEGFITIPSDAKRISFRATSKAGTDSSIIWRDVLVR